MKTIPPFATTWMEPESTHFPGLCGTVRGCDEKSQEGLCGFGSAYLLLLPITVSAATKKNVE